MNSVKKNFIYNSLSSILTIIIPLITTPYISRILGPNGLGVYSYNYSIAAYFVTFAMLGLNNYGTRIIASVRDDKEKCSQNFCEIYAMQIIVGSCVASIYVLYALCISNQLISWIMLAYVISAMFDINWFFYGMELFKLTVARNIAIKLVSTIAIFIFVRDSGNVWIYAAIIVGSILISQLSLWPFLNNYILFKRPSIRNIMNHMKPNLILFIPSIAISIYKLMDKIMLGLLSGSLEVGYYEASEKLIQIPNTLVVSLGTVMLPRMSNLIAEVKTDRINEYMKKTLQVALLISIPMSFGIMATANQIVPIFFGQGYETCITILQFLMPSCIFVAFANVIRTEYLIPKHYDSIYIKSVFIGAALNFTTNCILIKFIGATGAAIGTLIAECSVCIYQLFRVRKEIEIKEFVKIFLKIFFAGCVMLIIVSYFQFDDFNIYLSLIMRVLLGIIIFCGIIAIQKMHETKFRKGKQ